MPRKRTKRPESSPAVTVMQPNAAGIDVGATEMYVAVPEDRDPQPVRCFATFTPDLHALADWLQNCRIRSVAMEPPGSTGFRCFRYWKTTDSKSAQLMRDMSRTCPAGARTFPTAAGSNTCTRSDYSAPLSVPHKLCARCGRYCGTATISSSKPRFTFCSCRRHWIK